MLVRCRSGSISTYLLTCLWITIITYGHKPPKWLSTDLILSQFAGHQDCHRFYREFVEKIRKKYAPAKAEMSIPQQRQMGKPFDPEGYLRRAEQIFGCDVHHFVHAKRLSGVEKEIRDTMLYGIWKTGQFKNEQVVNLFGISYSGVSHAVKSARINLSRNRTLQTQFNRLNSLFKL